MHGTGAASTLSRRHFIFTAASAAGGLMVGYCRCSGQRPRCDDLGTALERQRLCAERNRRLDRHRSGRLRF